MGVLQELILKENGTVSPENIPCIQELFVERLPWIRPCTRCTETAVKKIGKVPALRESEGGSGRGTKGSLQTENKEGNKYMTK